MIIGYVIWIEVGDVHWFFEIFEYVPEVQHQPLVVTVGEAGAVEVSAEDGDFEAAHDRQLVSLLDQSSLPLVEGVL